VASAAALNLTISLAATRRFPRAVLWLDRRCQ
jgi:hypothetical protein